MPTSASALPWSAAPDPQVIGTIHAVLCGTARPCLRPDGSAAGVSAINKFPQTGPVYANEHGLQGDEQGDKRVHGGPDKAIHHYPQEHYPAWQSQLDTPQAARVLALPGAFGENLCSSGMTEAQMCWGDQVRIGSALLELAQSRQPCWKLNQRFAQPDMALRVQHTGRTGWYWRVLTPGFIRAGDAVYLLQRPYPEWPLSRVIALLYQHSGYSGLEVEALRDLARLPLPPSWQRIVQRRLEHGQIEDWSARLYG